MELISEMVPYCHRCFMIDNSLDRYRLILEVEDGERVKIESDDIPVWVETYVLRKMGV